MTTHKFGVKLFITNPTAKSLKEFIPVFHGWIQRQALPGHMLLDVHDYSHVHHGPGILLVAHEANLSIDEAEGRRGLVYIRKQPGNLAGTRITLGEAPITIGRAEDSTLVITDDFASARHARLVPREGQWFVEDLGSTNGTYLDRGKVSGPTPVPLGVPIRIGRTSLELRP